MAPTPEPVLLEATCATCNLVFDLWGETENDGRTFRVERHRLACPNCLTPVDLTDIYPKESLA
jgi:hypothetical protein